MRVDGTAFFPTFASHVLYSNPGPTASRVVILTQREKPMSHRVSLLPPTAGALLAPEAKGHPRVVCAPAHRDEAQRS